QLDRVTPGREYNRNRRGRRFGRQRRRCGGRGDDGDLLLNQIDRQRWQSVILAVRPAVLDRHVLTLDVAGFLQTLPEPSHHRPVAVRRSAVEKPNRRHRRLLRARRERPCCRRAAEKGDERATLHSITSSARASSEGGTVRPSMRAVCALMTSSNLLDCTTGKSAGLAPLRIRPV